MCRIRVALGVMLVLLGWALCACAGGSALVQGRQSVPAGDTGVRDALRQIDALATPDGADAQTFAMLKMKFRDMLIAREASKLCATAPETVRSKVTDLFVVPDAGGARFTWAYHNEGDYNQNGWVNVSDLSILGIHYGKGTTSIDWALARPADGNDDGVINIGDLASIGIGFDNTVTRYVLEHSPTLGAGEVWSQADEALFFHSAIDLDGLRKFDYLLTAPVSGYYRVVPCDMALTGIPSDPVAWGIDGPGDWYMFGHDRQHTGRSPFTGPGSNDQKWSFATGSMFIVSSPVLSAVGTIYIGGDDPYKLYAVNQDGSLAWAFDTEWELDHSPAIGVDGTIYAGDWGGTLYAVNPDGSQKWTYSCGGVINGSPTIAEDGTIYIGCSDSILYAINADGSLKWTFTAGDRFGGSAAIGTDGTVYVGSNDCKLYAINADGSQRWAYTAGDGINSSPAIGTDGAIYVGCGDFKLHAINADGSPRWTYTTGDVIVSSPALAADGTIYVGSSDAMVYAVNPDGSLQWTFTTGSYVVSAPAISADGTIYVGSDDNNVYAIYPSGAMKWVFGTGGSVYSSPAIGADGTVYVGNLNGNLYAIGPGST